MEVKFDAADLQKQLNEMVKTEVLKLFSPERREELLRDAVEHILNGKTHYSGKTPLQDAFERATQEVLTQIVREEFAKNDALRVRMQELVTKAVTLTFFTPERETHLVEKLGDLFADFLKRDSRW